MKASAIKIGILFTVLIALASGCALGDKPQPAPQRQGFNHQAHVEGAGLECEICHEGALTAAQAGMPGLEACQTCHADDPAKTDPFLQNGKPAWSSFAAVSDEVKFNHQNHTAKGLKCEDCHGNMGQSQATGKQLGFTMDACMNCHAQRNVADDCRTCHTKIGKDVAPKSHELNWKRYHGQVARAQLTEPLENKCSLCHTEQTCSTCHQDTEPQSHVGVTWRDRGHGISARMDRSSCAVCHQSETCDTCHAETVPATHRGGWGEPRDNHCYTCHLPAQNESCLTCHQELTGHLSAPDRPDGVTHDTASEYGCRSCHAPALDHPDNGDSCRNCHR